FELVGKRGQVLDGRRLAKFHTTISFSSLSAAVKEKMKCNESQGPGFHLSIFSGNENPTKILGRGSVWAKWGQLMNLAKTRGLNSDVRPRKNPQNSRADLSFHFDWPMSWQITIAACTD